MAVKGIKVVFGADNSEVNKALKEISVQSKSINKELKDVDKTLKLDPSNTVLLAQKQQLLATNISNTAEKLRILEENQSKADRAFAANAAWEQQYTPLAAAIDETRNKLKELNAQQERNRQLLSSGRISTEEYEQFQNTITATRDRLRELTQQRRELEASFTDGHISAEEYRQYQREVESTRNSLQNLQVQLNSLDNTDVGNVADGIEEVDTAVQDASDSTSVFGDVLKANLVSEAIIEGVKELASALSDFAKEGLELASDLQEVQNVVDTTFGDGASKINTWAKSAAEGFGMSELSAKQFSGTMGAMLSSMGLSKNEVYDMSTAMTQLAGDMASFYNLDSEEAFEKIRSGISGETEPLKQLGINLSVANLNQEAMNEKLGKTYDQMTSAEQAILRYNALMKQTANAQGDFAKTSDSYANQQRILSLNMENLASSLGEKILPVMTELTGKLNDFIENGGSDVEGLFTDIGKAIEFVGDVLVNAVQFFNKYKEVIIASAVALATFSAAMKITTLITTAVTAIKAMAVAIQGATTAQEVLNVVMAANPIGLVVSVVAALTAGLAILIGSADSATEKINKLSEECKKSEEKVTSLKDELSNINEQIKELESTNGITLVNQEEIDKLKEVSTEIEYQLMLAERQAELDARKLEEKSLDSIYKAVDNDLAIEGLQENIDYASKLQARLKEVKAEWEKAVNAGDTSGAEELNKEIYNLNEQINNVEQEILDTGNQFETWSSGLSGFSSDCEYAEEKATDVADRIAGYFKLTTEGLVEEMKTAAELEAESARSQSEELARKTSENLSYRKTDDFLNERLQQLESEYNAHKILNAQGEKDEEEYYKRRKKILNTFLGEKSELWWQYYDEVDDYFTKQSDVEPASITSFNKEMEHHKFLVATEKETEEQYLNWLDSAYKLAYSGLTGYESDLYKYEQEVYTGRKSLAEEQTEAKKKAIKDSISAEKEYIETVKDKQNELIDNQISLYQKQKQAMEDTYDAQINAIDETINKLNEENEAKERANDLAQAQLDLQQAQLDLEKARKSGTKTVIGADGSVSYKADEKAISDAEKKLKDAEKKIADLKREEEINKLEKQKETLESEKDVKSESYENMITVLNEQKTKTSEYYEKVLSILESKLDSDTEKQTKSNPEVYKTLDNSSLNSEEKAIINSIIQKDPKLSSDITSSFNLSNSAIMDNYNKLLSDNAMPKLNTYNVDLSNATLPANASKTLSNNSPVASTVINYTAGDVNITGMANGVTIDEVKQIVNKAITDGFDNFLSRFANGISSSLKQESYKRY